MKLGAGATSRQAEIHWIEIDNRAYVTLSNGQTTVDSWRTYINPVKTVTASGQGTTDAGLSFDAGQSDVSYTLGDLTAYIRYDYTMFWTTFNLSIEYDAKVPIPFQNITQEVQQMDASAWTQEEMEDMAEEWHDPVEEDQ